MNRHEGWYEIRDADSISTPALVVYRQRIRSNIDLMLEIAQDPSRLCPHVKTHKSSNVLKLYLAKGVTQFKCSTLAELEMVVNSGAAQALLAVQPVGPSPRLIARLAAANPHCRIGAIFDNSRTLDALASCGEQEKARITVYLDIDNGMGRTGIRAGSQAKALIRDAFASPHLDLGGLHVYDGNVRTEDREARRQEVDQAMQGVLALRDELQREGIPLQVIAGGTPSFPIHAQHDDRICSPGTTVFWDNGYDGKFPDLNFETAAVLLTRVISKLPERRICVDLGHKAVASEMQPPRARFLNVQVRQECIHSEEHLVLELDDRQQSQVGDLLYAVPQHICPTVALHEQLLVVDNGVIVDRWPVTARGRSMSI